MGHIAEHHVSISGFGPITHCEIEGGRMTVITGPQASGKSTAAKTIYFFRKIKDEILSIAMEQRLASDKNPKMESLLNSRLRKKFMDLFGTTYTMRHGEIMKYDYGVQGSDIRVEIKNNHKQPGATIVFFTYGEKIRSQLREIDQYAAPLDKAAHDRIQKQLNETFNDTNDEIFYIPAGRSTITLLSEQLNYLFLLGPDAWLIRAVDQVLKEFVGYTSGIKPWFRISHEYDMEKKHPSVNRAINDSALKLLHARYRLVDDEERLYLDEKAGGPYVKLNFSSSGQQEAVWIMNLLNFFSAEKEQIFVIIEEPEAHLFPEAQMLITDVISIFVDWLAKARSGNSVLVTTHSPYILGALNSLIVAGQVPEQRHNEAKAVIDKRAWIPNGGIKAYHTERLEEFKAALDSEGLIMNELIDGASDIINERVDKMISLMGGGGN